MTQYPTYWIEENEKLREQLAEARVYKRIVEEAVRLTRMNDAMNLIEEMKNTLVDIREDIDGQIDVVDGDYGQPEPNAAMSMAAQIDEVLASVREFEGR